MTLHRFSAVWILGMGLSACVGERPQFGSPRPPEDASDATASEDDAAVDATEVDETDSNTTTASDDTAMPSTDSTADATSDDGDTTSSGGGTSTDTASTDTASTDTASTDTASTDTASTSDNSSQTDSTDTGPGMDDAGVDAECGNGTVEGTEACDDGNLDDGDGCTACVVDPGWTCTSGPSQCEPPAPPVITSFAISTDQLPGGGGEVTLSWAVTGADTVRIEAEGADDIGEVTGQLTSVNVDRSTTFTLIAENAGGKEESTRAVEVTSKGTETWYVQFGTTASDQATAVTADADGNVIVVGETSGNLGGENKGGADVFVSKYTATKELKWHRQLGTDQYDYGRAVATDAKGAAFVLGSSLVAKYTDDQEDPVWVRQSGGDQFQDIALTPNGDVYIVGTSGRARFLTQFSNDGERRWTETVDALYDSSYVHVAADAQGDVFMTGFGYYRDASGDWFVDKYRGQVVLRTESYPMPEGAPRLSDSALSSGGNLVIIGHSPAGQELFLNRYSSDVDELSAAQLATDSLSNVAQSVLTIDPSNNSLIAGPRYPSSSSYFVRKYGTDDALRWSLSRTGDPINIASSYSGMVFVVGATRENLSDDSDSSDAFILAIR